MDFEVKIGNIAKKVATTKNKKSEAVTKQSLIVPLITALGYDPSDTDEVCPEYTADFGTKKGEKVDYAILKDGNPVMFIECKPAHEELTDRYESQLHRYFSVTPTCRIAILTNGIKYKFFSDFEKPNVLDKRPFFEIDLENTSKDQIVVLKKFSKFEIDIDKLMPEAKNMLMMRNVISIFNLQLENPSEDFVRTVCSKCHDGKLTQKVINEYTPLIKRAFQQIIADRATSMLKITIEQVDKEVETNAPEKLMGEIINDIKPTEEEIIGFNIVRAICMPHVAADRIFMRKSETYCAIILDNNNRKPLLRMYFNKRKKFITTLDANKRETKIHIDVVPEIYKAKNQIRASADMYMSSKEQIDL